MPEFTTERPLEGSWVVYFNGIEVPVRSVTVQMGVWDIPTATIEMPPDKELLRFGAEDKVQVAIFYLDNHYTELRGKEPDFRLLYEGYITGWQFTNTPSGRTLTFNTVNYLAILDSLYAFFMSGLDSMVTGVLEGQKVPALEGGPVPTGPQFPAQLLYMGLDASRGQMIRRPFDLLENVIRACLGSKEQKTFASVPATNFYARFFRRAMFNNRIVPSPLLEIDHMRITDGTDPEGVFPILRYVRHQNTLDALRKHMDSIGSSASIWMVIRDTFMRLYYEILAITTAPIAQVNFVGAGVNGEVIGPPVFDEHMLRAQEVQAQGLTGAAAAAALTAGPFNPVPEKATKQKAGIGPRPNRLLNYITKPEWRFGIPPSCNIIFPSMIEHFAYEEDYDKQATRTYINDDWLVTALNVGGAAKHFAIMAVGYPRQVQEELDKRGSPLRQGDQSVSGKNFLVWAEEYFKGPVVMQESLPQWFAMLLSTAKSPSQYNVKTPPVEQDPFLDQLNWTIPPGDGELVEGKQDLAAEHMQAVIDNAGASESARLDAITIKLSWLEQLYARYEYYRQRSSCRGGVVNTIFNPYIVPGFPLVVFDDMTTGNHVFGYVTSVRHTLAQDQLSTTVTFSNAQTIDEYLRGIRESRNGVNPEARKYIITANPPNPIPELRLVEQVMEQAEAYFSQLFHQRQSYADKVKTAAFDITKAINLVMPSGEIIRTPFAVGVDLSNSGLVPLNARGVREIDLTQFLDKYAAIKPTNEFADMFEQASLAMRFVARPICTLEEYIGFHERGIRQGKIPVDHPLQGKGAVYYEKILSFEQGPGPEPVLDDANNLQQPVTADTRTDWETRLMNYRKKVIFQLHPQES